MGKSSKSSSSKTKNGDSSKSSRRRRETPLEEDPEHERETKRLRTFSNEDIERLETKHKQQEQDSQGKPRRRTRSMDKAEDEAAQETPTVNDDDEKRELSPDEWRREHHITIRGHGDQASTTDFPAPFREFRHAPFAERIQQAFVQAGFSHPTAIQSQAWPIALQHKDMICIAKTGSGTYLLSREKNVSTKPTITTISPRSNHKHPLFLSLREQVIYGSWRRTVCWICSENVPNSHVLCLLFLLLFVVVAICSVQLSACSLSTIPNACAHRQDMWVFVAGLSSAFAASPTTQGLAARLLRPRLVGLGPDARIVGPNHGGGY